MLVGCVVLATSTFGMAQVEQGLVQLDEQAASIPSQFFASYCNDCHREDAKQKFDLNSLSTDFSAEGNQQNWLRVREQLVHGFMPPKEEKQPEVEERNKAIDWIESRLIEATKIKR